MRSGKHCNKYIAIVSVILAMAMLLCGCNTNQTETAANATPTPVTDAPQSEPDAVTQPTPTEPAEPVQEAGEDLPMIYAHVNGSVLSILPADNPSSEAYAELLKTGDVTVNMHDYGSFEKVGALGTELTRSDEQITTEPGDVILYQGNQITIYYDVNTWSFTRLGKVQGLTQQELKAILGEGDVTVTFSLNPAEETTASKNVLVVFFSRTGHTKPLAEYAAEILNADLYEIEAKIPYTDDDIKYYTDCRADREQQDPTARPEIAGELPDVSRYDTILIGYPIWHGQAPKIIYTFLESVNLSRKWIIPFCTSASSPVGSSAENLHPLAPDALWEDGTRFAIGTTREEILEWLSSQEYEMLKDEDTIGAEAEKSPLPEDSAAQEISAPTTEQHEPEERLTSDRFVSQGVALNYALYAPETISDTMPMIVFLHGSHGRGDDIEQVLDHGFPRFLLRGELGNIPAWVLMPQLPENASGWEEYDPQVIALINDICETHPVDRERISLTGHSMGGIGTWKLAIRHPDVFSCIAPISGKLSANESELEILAGIPTRAFVGDQDITELFYDENTGNMNYLSENNPDFLFSVIENADHSAVAKKIYTAGSVPYRINASFSVKLPEIIAWLLDHAN